MAVRNATLIDFTTAFTDGPGFYRGVVVAVATGSGSGSESATGLHVHPRAGSASGAGSSALTELHIHLRTASGSGAAGASTTLSGIKQGRAATGSGAGTASITGLHKHLRTGSDSAGTSEFVSASGVHTRATFTPPTDNQVDFTGSDFYGLDMIPVNKLVYALYRHYEPGPRGRNVWKLKDGTFTENQPMDDSLIEKLYHGGHTHVLTEDGEKAALVAAGYGDYVT